jgi:hypothetical protein
MKPRRIASVGAAQGRRYKISEATRGRRVDSGPAPCQIRPFAHDLSVQPSLATGQPFRNAADCGDSYALPGPSDDFNSRAFLDLFASLSATSTCHRISAASVTDCPARSTLYESRRHSSPRTNSSLLWTIPRIQLKSFVSTESRDPGNPSNFLFGGFVALVISSPPRGHGLSWPAVILQQHPPYG